MAGNILTSSFVIPAKAGTHGQAALDRKNLPADGWGPGFCRDDGLGEVRAQSWAR
jgi:hypothetical protein